MVFDFLLFLWTINADARTRTVWFYLFVLFIGAMQAPSSTATGPLLVYHKTVYVNQESAMAICRAPHN